MLAALLPCRSQFHRKTSLMAMELGAGWIVLILVVLASSVWLGLFAYKHVDYSHELWWQFALHGDAPRFLRATAGAAALILLYATTRLLRPARPEPSVLDEASATKVQAIVRACPKTYAHLALIGDKRFLFSQNERAFIMYGVEGRSWVSMGDPIGPQETWEELAWKFIELCDRYDGQPVFYQVESQYFDLYANLGMTFQKLGEEARVPLPSFSLEGSARKDLRHAVNKFTKEGYVFEILPAGQPPDMIDRLKAVSDAWLAHKNTRRRASPWASSTPHTSPSAPSPWCARTRRSPPSPISGRAPRRRSFPSI